MSNQNFEADQARRNFNEARHRFGTSPQEQKGWVSRHIPGGPKILWILLIVLLVALFVWWILPGKSRSMPRGMMGGPQPVGVATVQKGPIDVTLNALGTVTPLATVSVRPQVSGTIIRFSFKEGQMVKAGDVLAEIDPRPFQASLSQAQGALTRDQASLANARLELKRQKSLMAANATSQQNVDNQIAAVKQYEGTVISDQANVTSAQVNLGYTKVSSPVAGRAGIRGVDVGNFVSAGQTTAIVTVTQITPISVLFTIPEDQVHAVLERFNAGEGMQVDVYDRAQAEHLATGRLTAVDSYVDTSTGTVKLRAMFANDDGQLFANQFVNVRLLVNTLQGQVIIPAAAVQRGASGTFVFVVRNDDTDKSKKVVTMRAIKTGVQQGDKVAVLSGLNPGETVVTDGGDRLRDGAEVSIPTGQAVKDVAAPSGSGAPSGMSEKERAERRAKFLAACGADLKKYCAGATGREAMMCMAEHRDDVSDTCKTAMKSMRRRGPGGGPGGRPPGGP
ncbi:multidrug efflux system membrane fusion protein [Rhizomicrobium palustre]|uniref:Multidrug efflux system membrane fusion protein n=1 Tax=Rhizomicrobium palustre TaxID=189966 RepID=A0A846MZP8_9PROT|nr:efflux RND transporter periplasmic adaptor subunit [Rhizomicrobium palustre]NIK88482.1 multidrug efflux system membrane fusion protein [Rhizomicrobium palustre]